MFACFQMTLRLSFTLVAALGDRKSFDVRGTSSSSNNSLMVSACVFTTIFLPLSVIATVFFEPSKKRIPRVVSKTTKLANMMVHDLPLKDLGNRFFMFWNTMKNASFSLERL